MPSELFLLKDSEPWTPEGQGLGAVMLHGRAQAGARVDMTHPVGCSE